MGTSSITGCCSRVIDGDTIDIKPDGESWPFWTCRIRLLGVDCPERDQPFGDTATDFTREFCGDQLLTAIVESKDRYGRHLAWIKIGDKDLIHELLRAGLAWHFKKYSDDAELAALENKARDGRVGIWSAEDAVAPWDWRD